MPVKKNKSMNFIIPLAIYPFDVMVSLNENIDVFSKSVIKKWGAEILEDFTKHDHQHSEGVSYVYTSDRQQAAILRLVKYNVTPQSKGTLAHEVFHISEFVLRKCGLELNSNSHEAYAYLVGYLTQEIYKKI